MYTLQPHFFLQFARSIRADRTMTAATIWQLDAEQHPRPTNSEKNCMSYGVKSGGYTYWPPYADQRLAALPG
jgi:hypothetical protein